MHLWFVRDICRYTNVFWLIDWLIIRQGLRCWTVSDMLLFSALSPSLLHSLPCPPSWSQFSYRASCRQLVVFVAICLFHCSLLAFVTCSVDTETLLWYLMGDGASTRQQRLKDFSLPVSAENEAKSWAFLETRAQLLLKAYATTVQVWFCLWACQPLSTL